jgi:hypothetical protein
VTCRPIARKRIDKHVSVEFNLGYHLDKEHVSLDTSDQQTFPWILIRDIKGHSDQNEVSRSSEQKRERPGWSES